MPKKFDTMRHFLYELNHSFTILSITESWLKQYNRHTYNLKGYNHVSKIRETEQVVVCLFSLKKTSNLT